MTWSPLLFLAVLAVFIGTVAPVRADVVGPACVTDGDELAINGVRRQTKCVGGTPVRLFGIVAPDVDQKCPVGDGRAWQCGRASAAMLLEALKKRTVDCRGTSVDSEGRLMATCYVDGEEINRMMVRAGWALSYPRHSSKYAEDEAAAVAARAGLWHFSANVYFEWRTH